MLLQFATSRTSLRPKDLFRSAGKTAAWLIVLSSIALANASPVDFPTMIREMSKVKEKILAGNACATISLETEPESVIPQSSLEPQAPESPPPKGELIRTKSVAWAYDGKKWFAKHPTEERGTAWDGFRLQSGNRQNGKFYATVQAFRSSGQRRAYDPVLIGYFAGSSGDSEWLVDLFQRVKPTVAQTPEGHIRLTYEERGTSSYSTRSEYILDPKHDWIIRSLRTWWIYENQLLRGAFFGGMLVSPPPIQGIMNQQVISLANHRGLWLPRSVERLPIGAFSSTAEFWRATVVYSGETPTDATFNILKSGDEVFYLMQGQSNRLVVTDDGQFRPAPMGQTAEQQNADKDVREYLRFIALGAGGIALISAGIWGVRRSKSRR